MKESGAENLQAVENNSAKRQWDASQRMGKTIGGIADVFYDFLFGLVSGSNYLFFGFQIFQ
ncbi:MAG: hypothetical protein ACLS4Z_05690 [Christensenellaceae bacterium]